jgi:glycosyltransferase involved in cell wall biosynthesis
MRDLARAMAADGWHVTVVTTGPRAARERDGAVRIIRVKAPVRPRRIWSYMLIWLRLWLTGMRLKRRDLVVTMTDPPLLSVIGQAVAKAKRSRHIHWCQDMYPDLLPALGLNLPDFAMAYLRRRAQGALMTADKIIVVGRCMARRLVRSGIPAKKISVVPNWPDRELVSRNRRLRPANNNAVTRELFADSGPKFRVLYSGTMGRAHPVETVLEAAHILNASHPEIEFVFVGDGSGIDRIARARSRQGLDNIRLIPWQPVSRLRDLMESGDLHLISMNPDAAGMLVPCKLYSALAVARPCIFVGPSHCETARTIIDFNAGAVVAQGEAQQLADTILRYRLSSDAWFTAHEGARNAGKVFTPDEAIGAWIRRARAVIGARQKPRSIRRQFGGAPSAERSDGKAARRTAA